MRRAVARSLALSAAALAGGLVLASSSFAAGSTLYANGFHIATGAIVDPDGRVWVADHNAGFCRVTDPSSSSVGRIEHPQHPFDVIDSTCLGGLLVGAGTGPDAAQAPSFLDPTPEDVGSGDEIAFIPDGSSPSSEVVRAKWNPETHKFEFMDTISMIGDRVRPTATSIGPDGNLYVVFQKSGDLQRVVNPTAAGQPVVQVVGQTSDNGGAGAVAAGFDELGRLTVYIAEGAGLSEVRPATPAPTAVASFTTGAGIIGGLAYDSARHMLYAGSADAAVQNQDEGTDRVARINTDTNEVEQAYGTGYTAVGGLGLRPDGNLFVFDDKALIDPLEPLGEGLMYLVGLPTATITAGPTNAAGEEAGDRAFTNNRLPAFEIVAGDLGDTLQCSLVPAGEPAVWAACESPFVPAAELLDGAYEFAVKAVNVSGDEGLPAVHQFTVDTVAPEAPAIVAPTDGQTVSGTPKFEFAGEANAAFLCNLDGANGGQHLPCAPGVPFVFSAAQDGEHALTLVAVDRAGNMSVPSAAREFVTDATAPVVEITSPAPDAITGNSPRFAFGSDDEDVEAYQCRIDDKRFVACASPLGYADISAGQHSFTVRGIDHVGNRTTVDQSFTVFIPDTTAPDAPSVPDLTIESDAGALGTDDLTNVTRPTFSGVAEDGSFVTILVDGEAAGSGTAVDGRYSVTLDADLSAGEYVISATAMDDAGNESVLSAGMVITIDLEAPTAFATPGGSVVRLGQPVTLQSPDANARIFYTRDGSQPSASSTRYNGPIGITTNGTLRYIAVDAAGNASGVMSETYAIDSASPQVAVTAPADGAELRGLTRLSATASDNLEVARVQFQVDGIDVGAADTAAPYQLDWDSASVLDGTHVITAVAYDRSGNAGVPQTVATVNVINGLVNPAVEAPVAKLTALGTAAGTTTAAVKTSDVDLSWSATHPAGIQSYELQRSLNGGPWETFNRNAATTASQQLAAGTYEFRVRATSNDDTVAISEATTVVVRNVQESAATFTGRWTTATGANFWNRSLRHATAATARATYQFTGTSIGVIGTRAAGRGRMEITIDDRAPVVVNLYNATAQYRRLVFVQNGLDAGPHTIVVRALNQRTAPATANRVDLDGFVVLD